MATTQVPDSDKARAEGRTEAARNEVEAPSSLVARFGPTSRWRSIPAAASPTCRSPTRPMARSTQERSNAILVCHALTGDQHVASDNPVTGKPGWWSLMVGPGKPIDTDRYFVICSNVVGGCMGTTGPASTNPATGRAYGLDLPVITVRDMVRAQAMLIDQLGIDTLFSRRRRLARRHAGAAMGGELSRARLHRAADRHRRPPFLAEHRLPRGRPPGGDGRSRLARRPLHRRRRQPAQGAGRRAHGGAHHLPVGGGAAPQVRPQPAGPRQADLRLRRRFPDRVLSAPSGHRPSSTASTPTPIST